MPNDLINFAASQAARDFGSRDGEFTARRFWEAFCRMAEANPTDYAVYDRIVSGMLAGRSDIQHLPGGRYRLLE